MNQKHAKATKPNPNTDNRYKDHNDYKDNI